MTGRTFPRGISLLFLGKWREISPINPAENSKTEEERRKMNDNHSGPSRILCIVELFIRRCSLDNNRASLGEKWTDDPVINAFFSLERGENRRKSTNFIAGRILAPELFMGSLILSLHFESTREKKTKIENTNIEHTNKLVDFVWWLICFLIENILFFCWFCPHSNHNVRLATKEYH